MRILWAVVSVICGVLGGATVWQIGRAVSSHVGASVFTGRLPFALAFGLSLLYVSWRSALRARRRAVQTTAPLASVQAERGLSRQRVVAAVIFAIIVMSVSFAVSFLVAESGAWGGENGILGRSVWFLGYGIPAVAVLLHQNWLFLVAEAVQFSFLVAVFYFVATRRARRLYRPEAGEASGRAALSILPNRRTIGQAAVVLGAPILLAVAVTAATRPRVKEVIAYQGRDGRWHNDTERVVPPMLTGGQPVFSSVSFEGKVVMKVLVNERGKVEELRIDDVWVLDHGWPKKLRGIDVEEANDVVTKRWAYEPATLEGQPVPVYVRFVAVYHPVK